MPKAISNASARIYNLITGKGAAMVLALFFVFIACFTAYISIYAQHARAATNSTINFQARVLTSAGALVPDGSYSVEFKIYNVASGGTEEWAETQSVSVKNGYITASLGSVTVFGTSIDWSQEHWLTMNINGDGEMGPNRMKITAVPYAFRSGQADTLTTAGGVISASQLAQLAPGSVQGVNSANTALRINQTGVGNLLQLQTGGINEFTVANNGDTAIGGELSVTSGITVGNSSSTTAGTLRWNGVDFEGYDGVNWVSFTSGGSGGSAIGKTVVKSLAEIQNITLNPTATLQNDDELFFAIGANETWTYRFVVQANSPAAADLKFAVTGPAGATCTTGVINAEDTVTIGNLGCGVSSGIMNTATAEDVFEITGTIVNGPNAGNVTLQWAQNTANAGNTTFRAGSYVFATSNGALSTTFTQGGNSFTANAILGTTDNYNLNFITNGATRLTVANTGDVTIAQSLTVGTGLTVTSGGIAITGNSTVSGTLSGLTGLTVDTGGADITGGLLLNGGDILGIGNNLTASGALLISSGVGSSLQLDSGNDILVLSDNTLQRNGAGITYLELNDSNDTTLQILNSSGSGVANLVIEGSVTALDLIGNGSGLTALNASNITTGSLNDSLLSANVALVTADQTFTGRPEFTRGIILGNTATTTAGLIRFTGADFEGYDGSNWLSLTGGGGSGVLGVSIIQAYDNTGGTDINTGAPIALPWDTETKKDTGFTHDNVTNNTRITIDDPGWYRVSYQINAQDQTANRVNAQCQVRLNGTTPVAQSLSYSYGRNTTDAFTTNSASVYVETLSSNEYYEVICQQAGTAGSHLAVAGQSWTIAEKTAAPSGGIVNAFEQGGNSFGATAILGTGDLEDLRLVTNGSTVLELYTSGDAEFKNNLAINGGLTLLGNATLNGNTTIGDLGGDSLTINAGSVLVPNGLNIDTNTLVIDSTANTVGINNSSPDNLLSINTPATSDALAQGLIYTNAATNKGLVIQSTSSQSANLFELQQNSGLVLAAFSSDGQLLLGGDGSSPVAGLISFNDSTGLNGFTSVLGTNTLTASRAINLPNASGTICLANSDDCGYSRFAQSSAQVDSTINNSLFINKTGASGNIISLQNNGTTSFSVLNSGALELRLTDTSAFSVKDAGGSSFFNIDTSSGLVQIGSTAADANATLLVLDTKNTAGDPTGVNGGSYYNSVTNKFRCYQNNLWQDCLNSGYSEYTIMSDTTTYSNAPAADTEFIGTPRKLVDLTTANEFRLVISRPAGTVTAGHDCRLQYATTEAGPWANLDGGAGPEVLIDGAGGIKNSPWTGITAGAKADRYLRIMCKDGNGANDPQFRSISIQVR